MSRPVVRPVARERQYYEERADGLRTVLPDGAAATIEQVRAWHPAYASATDDAIRGAGASGAFTIDDARLVYAREHGFADWAAFMQHLERIATGAVREPFLELLEAGKAGEMQRVAALLRAEPDLVTARGTNGNTLLNLASSLVPCPAPRAAPDRESAAAAAERLAPLRMLLAAGADANQGNDRGFTPLHQAGYRNDPAMASLLLEAGARSAAEAHGEGGTPLAVALFWGHREVAGVLAAVGVAPSNLRVSAGLGRTDLVRECFAADGSLTTAARAGRGFYRPHSGFPTWRPADDAQQVLDEALAWAARSDRVETLPVLLERGARIDTDVYRGTPLVWAAATGRADAVRWLLDHGADPNQRSTFGGPSHGEAITALHVAAQSDSLAVVALLLERGADAQLRDALYGADAASWAEHGGAKQVVDHLRARGT